MIKLKLLIIILLALLSLIYNFINGKMFNIINDLDLLSLVSNQVGINGSDSFIGILFDCLISFLFNFNISDFDSIFKIFGG